LHATDIGAIADTFVTPNFTSTTVIITTNTLTTTAAQKLLNQDHAP
jgi:hypothetical protein